MLGGCEALSSVPQVFVLGVGVGIMLSEVAWWLYRLLGDLQAREG